MKVLVVYDNDAKPPLKADWGFSAIVEKDGKRILFDTGTNPGILKENLKTLGQNLDDINTVIISHTHADHTGGLSVVRGKRVISPEPLGSAFVVEKAYKGDWYGTRVLNSPLGIKEQYLYVPTEKGLFLLVGCSHPGLSTIIRDAKTVGNIYCVMGGFHSFSKLDALKGIPRVYPCHCTAMKKEILEKFKTACECYAGCEVEI